MRPLYKIIQPSCNNFTGWHLIINGLAVTLRAQKASDNLGKCQRTAATPDCEDLMCFAKHIKNRTQSLLMGMHENRDGERTYGSAEGCT